MEIFELIKLPNLVYIPVVRYLENPNFKKIDHKKLQDLIKINDFRFKINLHQTL